MGRLRVFSGRDMCHLIAGHGFAEVRQRGSHVIMQKRLPDTTITVPVLYHREIRPGTLSAIIRQSQLPRELFEV